MSFKPETTGSSHILPFNQLSPDDFERMCVWLVKREGFQSVEHLGAAGSEQGRDIIASRDGNSWAFQCKRVQQFGYADAKKEIDKLPKENLPEVYAFMVSSNFSADSREKIRADFPKLEFHFWAVTELDEMVNRHPEIVDEFFKPFGEGLKTALELIQDLQEAVERWKADKTDEGNLRTIQNVIQSGGVNFGQNNQVSVSGPVIGTVNLQFQTAEQAQAFLDQLQQYQPSKPPPTEPIESSEKEKDYLITKALELLKNIENFRSSDPKAVIKAAGVSYQKALIQLRNSWDDWELNISKWLMSDEKRKVEDIGRNSLGKKNLSKGEKLMEIRETVMAYTKLVMDRISEEQPQMKNYRSSNQNEVDFEYNNKINLLKSEYDYKTEEALRERDARALLQAEREYKHKSKQLWLQHDRDGFTPKKEEN
jgi:hypothetical protein